MLSDDQQKNYDYFQEHLSDYIDDPTKHFKFGVFFDCELRGVYDTFQTALLEACAYYPVGHFIIQQLVDPSESLNYVWMGALAVPTYNVFIND